jgi:hypothetical protein
MRRASRPAAGVDACRDLDPDVKKPSERHRDRQACDSDQGEGRGSRKAIKMFYL